MFDDREDEIVDEFRPRPVSPPFRRMTPELYAYLATRDLEVEPDARLAGFDRLLVRRLMEVL